MNFISRFSSPQAKSPSTLRAAPSATAVGSTASVLLGNGGGPQGPGEFQGGVLFDESVGSKLVVLPLESDGSFCGGVIGTSGEKMCCKSSCSIHKHKTKVEVIPICDRGAESGMYVFIVAKEDEAVFIGSVIPVELLPNDISFYVHDVRSAGSWGQYFRLLVARDEEVEVKSEATVNALIDHSHDLLMRSSVKRIKLSKDEGEDPVDMEREINLQLTRLSNIIGSHPVEMGPDTILTQLSTLSRRLDGASQLGAKEKEDLAKLGTLFAQHGSDLSKFKGTVIDESHRSFFTQIAPLFEWFSKWTVPAPKMGAPPGPIAGILDEQVEKVEAIRVAVLNLQQGANAYSPPMQQPNQFPWSRVSTQNPPLSQAPGNQNQGDLGTKIKVMQFQVDKLEEQIGGDQVTVGGVSFRSQQEFRSWWKANVKDGSLFICFCDPHALLNMAAETGRDNNEAMDFSSNALKAGFANDMVALARLSFGLPLPAVFGKESSKVGTRDSRILPGLKTAQCWDDGNQYTGQKTEAERRLRNTEEVLHEFNSAEDLSDEGQRVVLECQTRTSNFVKGLFSWMTSNYQAGVANGRASDPLWKYISHCVREIFNRLHHSRRAGRVPNAPPCDLAWGFLQAIKLADEFVLERFSGHSVLSHVLNLHLQDSAVMKEEFNRRLAVIDLQLKENTKVATAAKNVADAAVSKVESIRKKL